MTVQSEIANTIDQKDTFCHKFLPREENSAKKRSLFKQNVNLIEQKLKFAVYCLYYFCTILYLLFEKKKFCSSVLFRRHQETFLFDCHGNFVMIDTHPNMLITA